jgi:uncharacterized surface protein with fasciclin (FAS1) repeats
MVRYLQNAFCLLLVLFALSNCRKKEWNQNYGRPASLALPIYQQLDKMGQFHDFLKLVDKAGYKKTLEGAGYWTLFAPDDSAFQAYFTGSGVKNIDQIDSAEARKIVQYLLVYNSFKEDRLDDYQATANNAGWTPDIAFRRRTAFYDGFYQDTDLTGRPIVAIADNRNNLGALDGNYDPLDFNNKYISYFTSTFFSRNALSAADYTYFYPQSSWTGFNVMQAAVVKKDIDAENGTIDVINRVISAPPSIDQYLKTKPEYQSFRKLLDRLVQYIPNENATERYTTLTGKAGPVYVKAYSPLLSYSPNNENFLKVEDNDGQMNCWTMFVPRNQAVDSFVHGVLLKYYHTLDSLPTQILADFLNAHMFPTAVWPSKFAITQNDFGEPARFDPNSDVFDHQILSNGIVYGTDKVEDPDIFRTVYGEAYLNPNYTMMMRLFNLTGLNLLIAKSNVPVDIFLITDKVFNEAGYHYNESKSQFEYSSGSGTTTNNVVNELTRIVQTCVFFNPYKSELDDLSGSGIVKSGDAGIQSEYIKYDHNTILTAGLQDAGEVAHIDSEKTAVNGQVYYLDKLPIFTENTVGHSIEQLGEDPSSEFNYFWQYLSNSSLYSSSTQSIIGLSGFNTVFIPDNAAILKAVNDGVLPGSGAAPAMTPDFTPKSPADQNLVREFIQYHILKGTTVVPDGQMSGNYNTYLQDDEGNSAKIGVANQKGSLTITDDYGNSAGVIVSQSNHLSNRCVIHLIDNYLRYKLN